MNQSKSKLQRSNRHGFTMVELMVSLAIFGVVMGVVFGFLVGARNSYQDTRERVQYQQSMRAVMSLGMMNSTSAKPLHLPPSLPRNAMVFRPLAFAISNASKTFALLPLVVKPASTSPLEPTARTWRAKISCGG